MFSMKVPRAVRWGDDELGRLLHLYMEAIQRLRRNGIRRDMRLYDELAEKMMAAGWDRTGKQIKEKINNLKKIYKGIIKKSNAGITTVSASELDFKTKLQHVFGRGSPSPEPATVPVVNLNSSNSDGGRCIDYINEDTTDVVGVANNDSDNEDDILSDADFDNVDNLPTASMVLRGIKIEIEDSDDGIQTGHDHPNFITPTTSNQSLEDSNLRQPKEQTSHLLEALKRGPGRNGGVNGTGCPTRLAPPPLTSLINPHITAVHNGTEPISRSMAPGANGRKRPATEMMPEEPSNSTTIGDNHGFPINTTTGAVPCQQHICQHGNCHLPPLSSSTIGESFPRCCPMGAAMAAIYEKMEMARMEHEAVLLEKRLRHEAELEDKRMRHQERLQLELERIRSEQQLQLMKVIMEYGAVRDRGGTLLSENDPIASPPASGSRDQAPI